MEISLRQAIIGIIMLVVAAILVTFSIVYSNNMNTKTQTQTDKMFDKVEISSVSNDTFIMG